MAAVSKGKIVGKKRKVTYYFGIFINFFEFKLLYVCFFGLESQ